MNRRKSLFAILALVAGNAIAQDFPAGPVKIYSVLPPATAPELHLQGFAQIASRYVGKPVTVEILRGANPTTGIARTAEARADGYTLCGFPIVAYRLPHMGRVRWDPIKDFTYIIGIAAYTFGVVVKADSPFKALKDLIDYAKANPGQLRYGAFNQSNTSHLNMMELASKAGVNFLFAPGSYAESKAALMDGRIMAISDTSVWGPDVDSGAFRLLVTFGEARSRWNAPTAKELGYDVVSYSPIGIVGPKGMEPKVVKLLHDAFNRALDDPEYAKLLRRFDMVDWYRSSQDYADWAVDQFKFQEKLIARTIGSGR
jgi:tripartite-type tricarboxylate transporter receptor subunit TctC